MKTSMIIPALLGLLAVPALAGHGNDTPVPSVGVESVIHGGNPEMSAAARDTVFLIGPWGSGAAVNGQFEDPTGAPAWNGWTSVDMTQRTEMTWHVDTYNRVSGYYSAWCGEIAYDACTEEDPEGGYGNEYDEWLTWYGVVGNPGVSTTIEVTATVNHNTEPGYDFSYLGCWKYDQPNPTHLWAADGEGEQVSVNVSATYQPGEYVGDSGDQVRITWQVTSDTGWSDADCSYYGDGALQVDDITVTVTNDGVVTNYFHDFEDNTLGEWVAEFPRGVGDYTHLRSNLRDEDSCASNYSPAVCFIADDIMLAERDLPVEYCLDWCYGPGGYIVSHSGGAAGPDYHIHNAILSPPLAWPEGQYVGLRFAFDVYRHENLAADSPGVFFTWGVRSTSWADPIGLEEEHVFQDREFVYYGGPSWDRWGDANISDLLVPDARWVQVNLVVYELGYLWGYNGANGTPAPYFDNVRLAAFDQYGPTLVARALDLAQDAFPADGQIHVGAEMDQNDVRFDMANNIALQTDLWNDPGDSIVITLAAVRTGATLVETDVDAVVKAPRLHWILRPGPHVDESWRLNLATAGYTGTDGDNLVGEIPGAHAIRNDIPSPDRWMFDLPDGDFLFPGDILHYYFEAWDEVEGGYQNAFLPVERNGYGEFGNPLAYPGTFTMRALPTLFDEYGDHSPILFWNDFADYGGQDEWHGALTREGYLPYIDYDIFYTQAPSSGVGNGLGGRAQFGQLDGYDIMLYSCGDLSVNTISNLDYGNDAGDDVGVMNNWLEQGEKFLFATGDGLVSDLVVNGGPTTEAFAASWLGLNYLADNARPLLGADSAPMVYPVASNSVFGTAEAWIAYGGCPSIATFDAVTANGGEMLAEFNDGASGLSAATLYTAPNGSSVLTMPYDFSSIWTPRTEEKLSRSAPRPARGYVLHDVLMRAGMFPSVPIVSGGEVPGGKFTAAAYPNPFNPATRIEYNTPQAGRVGVKVFDIRGGLVRTLLDEVREAGPGHVMWDGTDSGGRGVSSGVYFYEVRSGGEVKADKIVMLK